MTAKSVPQASSRSTVEFDFSDLETGPLTRPLKVAIFGDRRATTIKRKRASLTDLAEGIGGMTAPDKDSLAHIKLGRFNNVVSAKGSHRTNANHESVSGIEADYDAGEMSPDEAAERLEAAGVAALIYTSPSNQKDGKGHRWRVLCPASRDDLKPSERDALVARVNGALGGVLAGESFTAVQSYAYGQAEDGKPVETRLVPGRYVDLCDDLDATAIGKPGGAKAEGYSAPEDAEDQSGDAEAIRRAEDRLDAAVERLSGMEAGDSRNDAFNACAFDMGGLVACGVLDPEEIVGAMMEAADACGYAEKYGDAERVIRAGLAEGVQHPTPIRTYRDAFDDLPDSDDAEEPEAKASRLTLLSPADCAATEPRPYILKGLIGRRDVGCIVGAPGVGKSLLGPSIGYAIAQGREVFGRRVKPGRTFYVAAEDEHGMRGRVAALRQEHGEADAFTLVSGVSDLLNETVAGRGSRDHRALRAAVSEHRPDLILIDTVAMAFPGLEENSAEGMGRVVAVARSLTAWGAAVVLVHHDTKEGGGLPRGHSLLNGALDFSIHLKSEGDGIVTGRLTKNRNGSCDQRLAFTIDAVEIGEDEDGDAITAAIARPLTKVPKSGPKL